MYDIDCFFPKSFPPSFHIIPPQSTFAPPERSGALPRSGTANSRQTLLRCRSDRPLFKRFLLSLILFNGWIVLYCFGLFSCVVFFDVVGFLRTYTVYVYCVPSVTVFGIGFGSRKYHPSGVIGRPSHCSLIMVFFGVKTTGFVVVISELPWVLWNTTGRQ